jgi:biotin-dependent carboxylase-like uncharacterized protein
MSPTLTVVEAGTLTTVQDRGRRGLAHLGVPRAGALDRPAAELALRLLGEDPDAALLEVTLGGLEFRLDAGRWVAVTGAPGEVRIGRRAAGHGRAEWVAPGETVRIGPPRSGVRSYVAVAGGIVVDPVLGSRSTDTLAGVGPPVVATGAVLPLGRPRGIPQAHDTPRPRTGGPLRLVAGPRDDWLLPGAVERLCAATYTVAADSNRVGLRLEGPGLPRAREGELASEGMVLGAVQVPPSGTPVVFLADHPPTGGYPVVGVVPEEDLWQCAQLRPGDEVRFIPEGPRSAPRSSRR